MSWKLFLQIVLLMLIAVIFLSVVKPILKHSMFKCGLKSSQWHQKHQMK